MTEPREKASLKDVIDFRVDIFKTHIAHVRAGQAMRYDILRYTIVGLALYFSFLTSQSEQRFVCQYPDIAILGLPLFVLAQVFLYISLVNRNIAKHGEFLKHFFREGLEPLGLGPNLYREFIREYRASWLERALERGHLHYSQLFLLALMAGLTLAWWAMDVNAFARCRIPLPPA